MILRFTVFLLLAALGGAAITVQAGLNGQVARAMGHPLWGTLVSLSVSVLCVLPMLVVFRAGQPNLGNFGGTPWWIWVGGALGALYITVALMVAPEIGAVTFVAAVVMGQVIASLLLDQFAVAGFPSRPVTVLRLVGAVLVVAGVMVSAWAAQAATRSTQDRPATGTTRL